MPTADIRNFIQIDPLTALGGQPTVEQFESVAADGYVMVVNLAPISAAESSLSDEVGTLNSLGLAYHHIPVAWDDPRPGDFDAFCLTMEQNRGRPIFVHCAMNFRVTAFYGLYAMRMLGWSAERADAMIGGVWGSMLDRYPVWKDFIARMKANLER